MDEKVKETTVVSQDSMGGTTKRTVRSYNVFSPDFFVNKTNQIIFTLVGIINLLVFIRFMLFLFGANRVGIVNFLMSVTNLFVAPFQGIFPNPATIEGSYFELASIVAIIGWFVFAWIAAVIIGLFASDTEA